MRADLHVHSRYSFDAFQSPARIVRVAERRSLDAVAVTDHDRFEGARVARRAAADADVAVVPGVEVRTDDVGDLLGLFVDDAVEARTFDAAVDEIHAQGGVAILPHPFRGRESVPSRVLERVDAVEGVNARSKPATNERGAALAAAHDVPTTGGSDAHTSLEVGTAYTLVTDPDVDSPEGLRAAIRAGAVAPCGSESPYYPVHALSVLMEATKATTGFRRV